MLKAFLARFKPAGPSSADRPACPVPAAEANVTDLDLRPRIEPVLPTDPESLVARAEAALSDFPKDGDEYMRTDLVRLRRAWSDAQQPDATRADLQSVFLVAHDLRGMAGAYGYPAIGRLGASLCTLLARAEPELDAALINLHVEACRAAFLDGSAPDAGSDIAGAVCAALESQVAKVVAS